MNKAYQFYLQNGLVVFVKRAIFIAVFILTLFIVLYFVGKHFAKNSAHLADSRKVLEITASRNASVNANREPVLNAFKQLSQIRKQNTVIGRQYIIEYLTKLSEQNGIANFIIEKVTQKNKAISLFYPDLEGINGIDLYEVELTFNTILFKQRQQLILNLEKETNGVVVVFQTETRRIISNINHQILEDINNGDNTAMLGHRLVLHWLFIT